MPDISQFVVESCKAASSVDWITPALSGLFAILGASVVAIANFYTTKKQVEASQKIESRKLHVSLVTSERLRWLQDLRDRLSNLYVDLDSQRDLFRRPFSETMRAEVQRQSDEISRRVMKEVNSITLMLNPDKPDQKELRDAVQLAIDLVPQGQGAAGHAATAAEYLRLKAAAFNALTKIGVTAWDKIQRLS